MLRFLSVFAFLCIAAPASAELNTYYQGFERLSGEESPLKGEYCVGKGRVMMGMQGTRSFRMIYTAKDHTLRMVSDSEKRYTAIGQEGIGGDMMAEMEKQLAQMPESQRAAARQMMSGMMASMPKTSKPEYVQTDEKDTLLDHECTRVNIFRDGKRRGEYWGSTSKDFALTPDERQDVLAMNAMMGNIGIGVTQIDGGGSRGFTWDPAREGYPLLSRCVEDEKVILELRMTTWDHKPSPKDLFEIPSGYHEDKMQGPTDRHRRGR